MDSLVIHHCVLNEQKNHHLPPPPPLPPLNGQISLSIQVLPPGCRCIPVHPARIPYRRHRLYLYRKHRKPNSRMIDTFRFPLYSCCLPFVTPVKVGIQFSCSWYNCLPFLSSLCYKLICFAIGKKRSSAWHVLCLIAARKNLIFHKPYPDDFF